MQERGPVNSLQADIPAQHGDVDVTAEGGTCRFSQVARRAVRHRGGHGAGGGGTLRRDRRANAAGGRSGPGGGVRAPVRRRAVDTSTTSSSGRVGPRGGNPTRMDSMGDVGDLRRRGRGDGAPAAAGGLSIALHGCTQRGARFRLLELCFRPCRGCGGPAGCRDHGSRGAWARVHPEAGAEECLPCRAQIVGFLHGGGCVRSRRPRAAARRPARAPRGKDTAAES